MDISVASDLETTSRPRGGGIEKKIAAFAAKLIVTGGCFWYVSRQIDLGQALSAIPLLNFRWTAFAVFLVVLQIPLLGVRWCNILDSLAVRDAQVTAVAAIAVTAIGVFFAQVLPSVAGEGVRAWLLVRVGCDWRTAVTSVVTPVVYLLALGVGLGVFVDRSADLPNGISYLAFVAPGLMAATAMQMATFEASFPVLAAIKWHRQYHAMLATPLRVRDVILGHQAYFVFRLLLAGTVYFVVITAFGAVESPLGVLAIPVTVLVGLSFTAPLAAWAAHTETEASFVAIFRFLILPMFLFSGTFLPISTLLNGKAGSKQRLRASD